MAFHETRFPVEVSLGARGGPERRTDIVLLGSGREERNARWADSRRRYNAGYGVKSLAALHEVIAFFEERRGRLHGFRWKDRMDFSSAPPGSGITPIDQVIGAGDGEAQSFQLVKTYGAAFAPWARIIAKPVAGSVRLALDGGEVTSGWSLDTAIGLVTFEAPPGAGVQLTAGFEFDVPVRFDTDFLEIDLSAFEAGAIPDIPLTEIRL
ncbi:MAG: DUF2460 domain-containing protein [Rhodobiaceae bacterium]|nr:DUF2460 domain-containing protein [Rhodobiaceae bacterium]